MCLLLRAVARHELNTKENTMPEYQVVTAYGDERSTCCKKAVNASAHHVCEFMDRLSYVCGNCLIEMIQMAGQQGDSVQQDSYNCRNWQFKRCAWITQVEVK